MSRTEAHRQSRLPARSTRMRPHVSCGSSSHAANPLREESPVRPPKWSLATCGEPLVVIEPTHKVLILTLDPAPPNRADEESGMRERGTRTKDNSGPTLQITRKGNRAEGPYTHNTITDTSHLLVSARTHERDWRYTTSTRHLHFATLQRPLASASDWVVLPKRF